MTDERILQVNHLSKSFGKHEVLRDIDFTVNKGDVTSIIGASGSGKSTLLRCINLLETPTSGEIRFHDENILSRKGGAAAYRTKVGMVFQSFNLFNNMTVLENCLVGQTKVLKKDPKEAEEVAMKYLTKVGMAPYINARPRQLSGGQKQRVGIARALVQDPLLILADEPIASLDPKSSRTVMEHLRWAADERGIACLVSLHQVEYALEFSDRIIAVSDGKLVFDGAPDDLTPSIIASVYGEEDPSSSTAECC